jgi:hypothetical protein
MYVDKFDDTEQLGECNFETKQIVLKKDLKPATLKKTFIHELIHAICLEEGIEIPHRSIYELEGVLYRMLRLNGWV